MISDICRQPGDGASFARILDPARGSGGMFVSSARLVEEHKKSPAAELSIHGVEKTGETGRLCRLNLAVHGLEGDPAGRDHGGNVSRYYDDPHDAIGSKLGIDATKKIPGEGFKRPWPPLIRMSDEIRRKIDALFG